MTGLRAAERTVTSASQPGPRATGRPVAIAAVATAVFTAWVVASIGGASMTRAVDDLGTVVASGVAAVCCAAAARRHDRLRRFWLLLALTCGAWTFGEAAWAVYDLPAGGSVPVPSYADIGYVGAIPLAVAALLSHPVHSVSNRMRVRATVEGAIVATALLFLSWTFALGPVWRQSDLSSLGGVVSVAYPFGDAVVLCLLVRVLRNLSGAARDGVAWVLVGLLAMAMSDSGYTYLTAVRGYETGNVIDVGWFVSYLAIAIGAASARAGATDVRAVSDVGTPVMTALTPFVPLFIALGVITVQQQRGTSLDAMSMSLAVALTVLVLVRQAIVALGTGRRVGGGP